jgi:pimeloyl-ACP methyl ester carboxylesterase
MPTTIVNGFNLYYEKAGTGPAIAFIHGGYGGAASSVLPRDEDWVGAFTDAYTVITYDRRSAGRSDYPDGDYTLDALASDLSELLHQLDVSKAFIIGSSGGGPVALTYALAHPETLLGLVLPNTSARLWAHEGRWSSADVIRGRIQFLKEQGPEAAFAMIQQEQAGPNRMVLAPGGSGPRPPDRVQAMEERNTRVQKLVEALDQPTRVRYTIGELRNQGAYIGSDLTPSLGEIDVPTLVIHGDGDLQVPYVLGVELAGSIAGAEMVTIPGAGHGVMAWKATTEAIRAFCDRVAVAVA